jgi:hypothetical protein
MEERRVKANEWVIRQNTMQTRNEAAAALRGSNAAIEEEGNTAELAPAFARSVTM